MLVKLKSFSFFCTTLPNKKSTMKTDPLTTVLLKHCICTVTLEDNTLENG